jgi:lysyl oxidase/IPT/TIG domain-containing protein
MHQRRLLMISAAFAAVLLVDSRAGFAQTDLLPNLVPLPASELSVVQDTNGHTLLRFAAVNTNVGAGPLELVPGGIDGTSQQIFQRIYSSDGSFHDRLAGTMTYHPQHNHFHFNNFARFTLTALTNASGSGQTSEKTSFCVEDTTPIDLSLPGAPRNGVYTTCNRDVQGISVGWADRYGPSLDGQSIDITGDPEGDYHLTIETDPASPSDQTDGVPGQLEETDDSDNVSCVRLHIIPATRLVQVLGICGKQDVFSITPNSAPPNSSVSVTITGSGFTDGIAVGFENGTGGAPLVSNVTVVNSTTITATVTVKKGGGKQVRYWDLRVGDGTLKRAFSIK